ncbi:MAG: methionyl-tRNA formyltransferase [Paludibacteraceae bacterium]|nr:methionyl-tRNA formyltransferase [Paludibacteraceae bacterium]
MTKEELRIVYMGTPEFAVAPLQSLLANQYNVVGVVTMPDKPAGRGHKLQASAVKQVAIEHNLPILQPEKLKDPFFLEALRSLNADLFIVVAFRMLPEVVWNMPRMGTFNLHASLLPQYRGAAPINWALIRGEKETGVTSFFLTHEIDTGDILLQRKIAIDDTDNAGSLHDKLMQLGAETVVETVAYILSGNTSKTPQNELMNGQQIHLAPKIFKETCRINWSLSCEEIKNFVRGLSPYPAAYTEGLDAKGAPFSAKILHVSTQVCTPEARIGTVSTDNKTTLKIACADGWVIVDTIQIAGKKAMQTEELLRGFHLLVPQQLT